MRVERTRDAARAPLAGFEDREDHRTPFASASKSTAPPRVAIARTALPKEQRQEEPCRPSRRWQTAAGNPSPAQAEFAYAGVEFYWAGFPAGLDGAGLAGAGFGAGAAAEPGVLGGAGTPVAAL